MTARRSASPRAVCLFYAGVVLGFSFVATPAKFFTPGVPMSDLLLVGRTTFGVFGWVEAALVMVALLAALQARSCRIPVTLIAAIVAVQYLGLRPTLDARVTVIAAGAEPTPSSLHHVYGVLELAKLAMLLWVARPARPGAPESRANP